MDHSCSFCWTFWWTLCLGYCKQYFPENKGAHVISNRDVLQVRAQKWDCRIPWLLCFLFSGTSVLFPLVAAPLCIPAQSAGGFCFPYTLCSIYSLEIFLMMAILTSVRGFLSVDLICIDLIVSGSSLVWLSSKESDCNVEDVRDVDPIPESGRSPEEGSGNPIQYSFLENSMDRRDWQATLQGIAKSPT